MANAIDLLSEKVNKILGRADNTADISKEDFRNYMGVAQSNLKAMIESFDELKPEEATALGESILGRIRDRAAMNIQIYSMYTNRLSGQAQREERKAPFASLVHAAKSYSTVLDELDKSIDKLFENKVISIYNTKLSHIAIMGVIKNACDLCDFSWFLFNGICFDIGMGIEKPAKYRFSYMNTVKEKMAGLVNDIYAGVGDGAIFNEILKLRRENKDMLVVNDNNEINSGMISSAGLNRGLGGSITAGLMSLNIFRWIGEAWNNYRDSHYRALEEKRDWMQTHVQMLRLKLQGMDTNDREYQKLQKIINNYDNMVAAADEKIKKYREED